MNSPWYTPEISLTHEEINELRREIVRMIDNYSIQEIPVVFKPFRCPPIEAKSGIHALPSNNPHTQFGIFCTSKGFKIYPILVVIVNNLHSNYQANLARNLSTLVHEYLHCMRVINEQYDKAPDGYIDLVKEEYEVVKGEIDWFTRFLSPDLANKIIEFNREVVTKMLGNLGLAAKVYFSYNPVSNEASPSKESSNESA